ncbi:polo kinase CDC5 [Ascoidea rubescens DSM 1968]|uniref:Serine/threonine-protein kinase n=1 Tax=Ascoidea rubescens DSM 1968 TaxID=1344418 RepID=A0A1D2VE88_9ASCO|nr:Pkinase-domain-containing protein [Ascoidea rubescens DSM 1968]ODV60018.1 Pkinase-domain-containing protein [Ascoidea rubescens DSM 1968]
MRGQPLQVIASQDLNSRNVRNSLNANLNTNHYQTQLPSQQQAKQILQKEQQQQQQQQQQKKKREKLSSLCKTPPSVIRTRTGKDYQRGLFLGEGGFARCFQIKDDGGKLYAAKTVAKASIKNEKTKTKLLSEIKIHKSMSHPNIVQFIDCFEDDVNVYILLEICSHGSLMDLLKKRKNLSEPEVRFMIVQIIAAIKYMHNRRVIHRDIKLGNIFFDADMNLKIGDFGLAAVLPVGKDRKYTICGTPNYIAPEVLTGKIKGHSFEVDTWSIGIMMYALLFGKPPFQSKDVKLIYERIKSTDYQFPQDKNVSDEAKILIKDILSLDPLKRPSLSDILHYKWFKGSFPRQLSTDILLNEPSYYYNIDKREAEANFYNAQMNGGLMSGGPKNPIEILKSDLESEQPKALLPQSLSPGGTSNKYKEMVMVGTASKRITEEALINKMLKPSKKFNFSSKFEKKSDQLLANECMETLSNINIAERQVRLRSSIDDNYVINKRPILISKWVDYSNKHGFSYQLSSNDIGVLFNNGNSILKLTNSEDFWYIVEDKLKGWLAKSFQLSSMPFELRKEMGIVEFFAKYMKTNLCNVSNEHSAREEDIWLRRYSRYDPYVMFELSNGSFQFNFRDHHKICISEKGRALTYISPDRTANSYSLVEVLRYGGIPGNKEINFEEKYLLMKQALKQKADI